MIATEDGGSDLQPVALVVHADAMVCPSITWFVQHSYDYTEVVIPANGRSKVANCHHLLEPIAGMNISYM